MGSSKTGDMIMTIYPGDASRASLSSLNISAWGNIRVTW